MANFRKHLEVATIGSGFAATVLLGADIISSTEALILWGLGTLGGILPDIDSDHSTALEIVFAIVSVTSILSVLSQLSFVPSILEIWLIIVIGYVFINRGIRPVFEALTVHRGVFHSLLAVVFFGALGVAVSYYGTYFNAFQSWLAGSFIAFGYLIHLTLDEIYSVDFMNATVKRSFGTALKPIETKRLWTSASMLVVTVALVFVSPDTTQFRQEVASINGIKSIAQSFFPVNWQSKLKKMQLTMLDINQ